MEYIPVNMFLLGQKGGQTKKYGMLFSNKTIYKMVIVTNNHDIWVSTFEFKLKPINKNHMTNKTTPMRTMVLAYLPLFTYKTGW